MLFIDRLRRIKQFLEGALKVVGVAVAAMMPPSMAGQRMRANRRPKKTPPCCHAGVY